MTKAFGSVEVTRISGGRVRMDGGCMFGVVPQVLWQREHAPDARNRIALDTNCLLVRTPNVIAVVETGCGTKLTEKEQERLALAPGNHLVRGLLENGVSPDDVELVILTHLHFDHAGGCTVNDGLEMRPTFPNATHVVQRAEWEDALGDLPELKGAYALNELKVLSDTRQVRTVEGTHTVTEGITVQLTGGHSRGHQIVRLGAEDDQAVFLGDLCPLESQLRVFWTMAFDQSMLDVRREKMEVLREAAARRQTIIFDHDPGVFAGTIRCKADHLFEIAETVSL